MAKLCAGMPGHARQYPETTSGGNHLSSLTGQAVCSGIVAGGAAGPSGQCKVLADTGPCMALRVQGASRRRSRFAAGRWGLGIAAGQGLAEPAWRLTCNGMLWPHVGHTRGGGVSPARTTPSLPLPWAWRVPWPWLQFWPLQLALLFRIPWLSLPKHSPFPFFWPPWLAWLLPSSSGYT